jgi:hypothetical protein
VLQGMGPGQVSLSGHVPVIRIGHRHSFLSQTNRFPVFLVLRDHGIDFCGFRRFRDSDLELLHASLESFDFAMESDSFSDRLVHPLAIDQKKTGHQAERKEHREELGEHTARNLQVVGS